MLVTFGWFRPNHLPPTSGWYWFITDPLINRSIHRLINQSIHSFTHTCFHIINVLLEQCQFLIFMLHLRTCSSRNVIFAGSSPCVKIPKILGYDLDVSSPFPGIPCQRWDSQTPWTHPYTGPDMFPQDATIADASNYCRNPDGGLFPWCYITYPEVPWMYCGRDILNCGKAPPQLQCVQSYMSFGGNDSCIYMKIADGSVPNPCCAMPSPIIIMI